MTKYSYKGWTIGNRGCEFTATKNGFFTGYMTFDTTGAFLDYLETSFPELSAA